jgi:hypothetical protein
MVEWDYQGGDIFSGLGIVEEDQCHHHGLFILCDYSYGMCRYIEINKKKTYASGIQL